MFVVNNIYEKRYFIRVFLLRKFKHSCIILNVLLYRCETWSPTFKEEHILEVFENVALRNILGPERKYHYNGGKSITRSFIDM